MATITIVAVLLNAGAVRHALSDEPTALTTSAETPQSAAEPAMSAAEAVPPAVEGQPGPPAEAGDIQERGLHQGTTPGLPQGGTASGAESTFQAPTPSLTAVANAIRVTSKSVSVNLRVPANMPVTVPVEISVAYISPVHSGRLTKTYAPSTGTVILYHEAEGDRYPRPMRLDISLRELIPNGKFFSFSYQLFTVIPLYDVFISSLSFTSITVCDHVDINWKNDILFRWRSPEGLQREIKFHNGLHEKKRIPEFKWARKEISTQARLSEPTVDFYELGLLGDYTPSLGRGVIKLLQPGLPERYAFILDKGRAGPPGSPSGSTGCRADIRYDIIRKLLTFDSF
jgi:hypothetical protein